MANENLGDAKKAKNDEFYTQYHDIEEVGLFGNQNTVAKPKSEKWEHTVSVLKKRFGVK